MNDLINNLLIWNNLLLNYLFLIIIYYDQLSILINNMDK